MRLLGEGNGPRCPRPSMAISAIEKQLRRLHASALDANTRAAYRTGARDYIRFCRDHGLSMAPTPSTLCRYLAHSSIFISSGPAYLRGASYILRPIYPNFDEVRAHPHVVAAIAGLRKTVSQPVKRAPPLKIAHLRAFEMMANGTREYDDHLFATIMSVMFYACHRSGELIIRTLNPRKIIRRASFRMDDQYAYYNLPFHKGDLLYRGTDIVIAPQQAANPITLLRRYIRVRDASHPSSPWLFVCADGSHPTRSWFNKRYYSFLGKEFGGHSARCGGATFYASIGTPPHIIQGLGRWSTDTWRIYIRNNPTVLQQLHLAKQEARRPGHS